MEHIAALSGLGAGVVGAIGYIPYIRDTLRHKTRPDRASWLIWTAEYAVLFSAQAAKGATNSLWLPGLQLAGVVIVAALSIKHGEGRFTARSCLLLGLVALGLLAWYCTSNALLALLISLAVETSGLVLTMIKTYKDPASETMSMWVLAGIGGVLGIVAVGSTANYALYIYPIFLATMCFGVVGVAWLGTRRAHRHHARSASYEPIIVYPTAIT
ncbi:MAG TPA: hypothetical protein VJP80_02895 [Candidatus Saccharimonadales bacterium]|nr:hypothetical protein [Candidatus Saccharimonadales bacterium]